MPPDALATVARYARCAQGYERRASIVWAAPLRRRALRRLALRPGDSVLDVACGTGINFAGLERAIGQGGRLVGVDLSPQMLLRARERVRARGWTNVELIESAVEHAVLPEPLDAALFSYTHDVLQSPQALERVLAALRPGARVVAAGAACAQRWALPVNAMVRAAARGYVTTLDGLHEPWRALAQRLVDARVELFLLGSMYVVSGVVADHPAGAR